MGRAAKAPGLWRAGACGVVTAAIVGHAAGSLEAAPATRTLEWTAPAGCPRPEYVTARIVALLGDGSDRRRPLDARANVERREAGVWRVSLTLRDGDAAGTRIVDAESCLAAADATALIVALAIDPSRGAHGESVAAGDGGALPDDGGAGAEAVAPPAPDAVAAAPPAPVAISAPPAPLPSPAATDPRPPDEAPAPSDTSRIAVGAGLAFDDGTLPLPSFGVGAVLAWTPRPVRVEIAGIYFPTRRSPLDATPTRGGDFSLATADLRGCYELTGGRLVLAPCAGPELAWVHAQGFGVDVPLSADGMWASVVAGVLAELRITRMLGVRMELDGAFPLARPRFELAGIAPVHSPSVGAVRTRLGIEARF